MSCKGSWEGEGIDHCEGACDLQPCLSRVGKILHKKGAKKCSDTCFKPRGF